MFSRLCFLLLFSFPLLAFPAPTPESACELTASPGAQACELPPPFPPKSTSRATARLGREWSCTSGGFVATHPDRAVAERRVTEKCTQAGGKTCRVERCVSSN